MEREQPELEVVVAAVAVGSALEESDLVVGARHGGIAHELNSSSTTISRTSS
jgi:hypothetical protein